MVFGFGSDRPNDYIYPEDPNAPRGTYRPRYSNTQDVADRFGDWSGGGDGMAALAQAQGQAKVDQQGIDVNKLIEELLGNGNSGNGSGYNVQAMTNQINDSFNRQQQGLDAAKGAGMGGIQNAYDQFSTNIGRNYADYTGAAQQAQAAMAQRVAQQIADAQSRQGQLQASAQSMGQDYGALAQQQAGNLDALRTSSGFQQDLSQRMAQIVADNQRSMQGSGELVRQGATGNLESNYLALLGALQSGREQAMMSAQYGGGGGGGGDTKERTAKSVYDELTSTDKLRSYLLGEDDIGGDFGGVSVDKLFEYYAANANSDDPNTQSVVSQILPYLAKQQR